jgi:hypothetical protein
MIIDWLVNQQKISKDNKPSIIIEVSGRTGSFFRQLVILFSELRFEVQISFSELLERGKQTLFFQLIDRVHFSARDSFASLFIQELGGEDGDVQSTVFLLRHIL